MAVERIDSGLDLNMGQHFCVLYGPGVQDTFVAPNLAEMDIEVALHGWLQSHGFERIVFFSPHRGVYFYDEDSRSRTLTEAAARLAREAQQGGRGEMKFLSHPSFGKRLARGRAARSEAPMPEMRSEQTEIAMLNRVMKDSLRRTALVFPQTENTLRDFQADSTRARRLFGLASEWARLPFSNRNLCVWLCGGDLAPLEDLVKTVLPDLSQHIQKRNEDSNYSVHRINGPEEAELDRLVDRLRLLDGMKVEWARRAKLVRWMDAEGQDARVWMGRLRGSGELSTAAAKRTVGTASQWFRSMSDTDKSAEELLQGLIGLENVKATVREFVAWAHAEKMRTRGGASLETPTMHLVFKGPPGTGKTTVARLIGEIFREYGLLRRGHTVEVERASDLVAGFVGQTSSRTHELIDSAMDGVLFIDEAYQLSQGAETGRGDFSKAVIDALLTRTENSRDRLLVIVAGYEDLMDEFISSNPGLPRRFPLANHIVFENYSDDELVQIWRKVCADGNRTYEPVDEVEACVVDRLSQLRREKGQFFGNGGEVRNLYEDACRKWASRNLAQLSSDDPVVDSPLSPEDLSVASRPPRGFTRA